MTQLTGPHLKRWNEFVRLIPVRGRIASGDLLPRAEKELGVPRKTAFTYLREAERAGIITREKEGRAAFYRRVNEKLLPLPKVNELLLEMDRWIEAFRGRPDPKRSEWFLVRGRDLFPLVTEWVLKKAPDAPTSDEARRRAELVNAYVLRPFLASLAEVAWLTEDASSVKGAARDAF